MKPFTVENLRTLFPDSQANPQEQEPVYLDWAFFNWGKEGIPPEQEPFKVTASLDLEDRHIYLVVEAKDEMGDDLNVPPEAFTWADQVTKSLIEALLQFEGVTYAKK